MLYKLSNLPLVLTMVQVGAGEFFAVSIVGIIVYKYIFVKLKDRKVI